MIYGGQIYMDRVGLWGPLGNGIGVSFEAVKRFYNFIVIDSQFQFYCTENHCFVPLWCWESNSVIYILHPFPSVFLKGRIVCCSCMTLCTSHAGCFQSFGYINYQQLFPRPGAWQRVSKYCGNGFSNVEFSFEITVVSQLDLSLCILQDLRFARTIYSRQQEIQINQESS